jgi:hypothetical protein
VAFNLASKKFPMLASESIWLATDFSDANAAGQTFSFLLVDLDASSEWRTHQLRFRSKTRDEIRWSRISNLPDRKHIDFIGFADGLNGYLLTVTVCERDVSNRLTAEQMNSRPITAKLRAKWKPANLWRATAVARLAGVFAATYLRKEGQLKWVSDADGILASDNAKLDFGRLFAVECRARDAPHLLPFGFITTADTQVPMLLKDLCSIPDLAAGLMHEKCFGPRNSNPLRTDLVGAWMACSAKGLKKINLRFRRSAEDRLLVDDIVWSQVV